MPRPAVISHCLFLALIVAAGLAPGDLLHAQPAAVDPKTLVGEWQGTRSRSTPEMSRPEVSQWYLIIERVEGDKVHLRREMPGAQTASFVGTVSGNQLTFGVANSPITFTIDGNRMVSKFRAPNGWAMEYDLRKK